MKISNNQALKPTAFGGGLASRYKALREVVFGCGGSSILSHYRALSIEARAIIKSGAFAPGATGKVIKTRQPHRILRGVPPRRTTGLASSVSLPSHKPTTAPLALRIVR